MSITTQSEVGKLKKVLLKHARDAFRSQEYIDQNWQDLNYLDRPIFKKAVQEYDDFVEIIKSFGVEIDFLPFSEDAGLDSMYVRDASIVTNGGIITCSMGKDLRITEPKIHLDHYLVNNYSILGSCQTPIKIEGGDVAWLDEGTLAVAEGYRTNAEGIGFLKSLISGTCDEVIVMESPHYKGPLDVFHLMSVLSPVDNDLAVVYSPLMSVPFRNRLIKDGINFIEVPDEEFETLGCNILAIAPRVCVMVKGNPVTKSKLEQAGVEVIEFDGQEICFKGSGGPTCLTRPLERVI